MECTHVLARPASPATSMRSGYYRRVNHFGIPPLLLGFACWLLLELLDDELELELELEAGFLLFAAAARD